jgi:hypothetical protein
MGKTIEQRYQIKRRPLEYAQLLDKFIELPTSENHFSTLEGFVQNHRPKIAIYALLRALELDDGNEVTDPLNRFHKYYSAQITPGGPEISTENDADAARLAVFRALHKCTEKPESLEHPQVFIVSCLHPAADNRVIIRDPVQGDFEKPASLTICLSPQQPTA